MRGFKLDRAFYIPKDARQVEADGTDAVVYVCDNGRFTALGFHGKAQRPDFHYTFPSAAGRDRYIAEYIERRRQSYAAVLARRAQKAEPHTLTVGDILTSSWGYDQTNIDFYEVTRVIGRYMVELREIGQTKTETHFMQGDCWPVSHKFIGPPTRHKVGAGNRVKVRDFGVWASPWKGGSRHWTGYA